MIEVERLSHDRLNCQVWHFSVDAGFGTGDNVYVRLQFYGNSVRASLRHKFKYEPKDRFHKSDQRSYNSGISAESVPMPDDVIAEAVSKVRLQVVDATQTVRQVA